MQSLLNNPRALQAMMQIQAGLSQLQLEAPSLAQASGFVTSHFVIAAVASFSDIDLQRTDFDGFLVG